MAWGRDSLRIRLASARSIEETGLDPSLYCGFMSPHGSPSPSKDSWSKALLGVQKVKDSMSTDENSITTQPPPPICSKCQHSTGKEVKMRFENASDILDKEAKGIEGLPEHGRGKLEKGRFMKVSNKVGKRDGNSFRTSRQVTMAGIDEDPSDAGISWGAIGDSADIEVDCSLQEFRHLNLLSPKQERVKRLNNERATGHSLREDAKFEAIPKSLAETQEAADFLKHEMDGHDESCDGTQEADEIFPRANRVDCDAHHMESPKEVTSQKVVNSPTVPSLKGFPSDFSTSGSLSKSAESAAISAPTRIINGADLPAGIFDGTGVVRKPDARSRWKRATNTVKLVNHMAAVVRTASADLIEHRTLNESLQQQSGQDDAGGVGAAAFEGAKTVRRSRSRGRKGMEGLLVRQDRCFVTYFQDFYVACLKMSIGNFLIGVLLAPVALGVLFTPLYLLDVDGLTFNGVVPEDATTSPFASAAQRCLAFLNIFLYALSLSTTFGGAPVAARSPFCLLVANVNTLLAQFLFVFLSGAVFARMSQPSYPIRCAKKAIIKPDDLIAVPFLEQEDNYKVFSVRLVLTGPPPCELVDAKICLTFRIFVSLPSGSVFCSTQELEVVRPEVPYLRYGLMVRHIIDKKSPVYGHTMRSLQEGDASFSLSVMGMERSSMQPVFHLEDYFVCDGDVIWDGDYVDFIHINDQGQRVLDHSLIDHMKPLRAATIVSKSITRMKKLSHHKQNEQEDHSVETESNKDMIQAENGSSVRNWLGQIRKRNLLTSKSTSFTRADW